MLASLPLEDTEDTRGLLNDVRQIDETAADELLEALVLMRKTSVRCPKQTWSVALNNVRA